ncbi:hypothetical protein Btru_074781 [Bulinus truncatus]|nr:hypothetical protein Btru_074781 [Bulinus truncatus]
MSSGKFERNQTDFSSGLRVIKISAPLSKIEIGHDNSGAGPGWYLDSVTSVQKKKMVQWTFIIVCLYLWTLSTSVNSLGGNLDLEQNCILSFVVPKDKMKSSCELDEKVNRRINAIEMKVNIYKQEVADLRVQLDKERKLNADKLERLSRERQEEADVEEINGLLEKRLAQLERTLEQLPTDLTISFSGKAKRPSGAEDKATVQIASESGQPGVNPSTVKTLVQSEMSGMFENFTKKLEQYVKEQVLFYNQIFRMLPKRASDGFTTSKPGMSPQTTKTGSYEAVTEKKMDTTETTVNVMPSSTSGELIDGGDEFAANNATDVNATVIATITESGATAVFHTEMAQSNNTEIILTDDASEANDTFSERTHRDAKTTETARKDVNSDISASRIGAKANNESDKPNATESSPKKSVVGGGEEEQEEEDRAWKENMIRDQNDRQMDIEERLRNEITALIYSPLSEVFSVIEKKSAALEEKIRLQEDKSQQAVKDLHAKLKDVDLSTKSAISQLESLSRGFQDSFLKMDRLSPLESTVNEMKRNLSADPLSKLELEDQGKRLKKLERLVGVYQQSLEHYRNETRIEYREVREMVEKNISSLRAYCKSAQDNATSALSAQVGRVNSTLRDRLKEIGDQVRQQEDNVLLLQIDLSSLERNIKGKAKNDKEMEEVQGAINELAGKQRDLKRKLDGVETQQLVLAQGVNGTAKELFELKAEVKLNVLEEWLPLTFEYDVSKTECHGQQYVKRLKFKNAKLVGVVLCSPTRYKIFLSNSLHSKFMNVGDIQGLGEDHCEFVGAAERSQVKLSPFKGTTYFTQGE